jgi:hypothetical protein
MRRKRKTWADTTAACPKPQNHDFLGSGGEFATRSTSGGEAALDQVEMQQLISKRSLLGRWHAHRDRRINEELPAQGRRGKAAGSRPQGRARLPQTLLALRLASRPLRLQRRPRSADLRATISRRNRKPQPHSRTTPGRFRRRRARSSARAPSDRRSRRPLASAQPADRPAARSENPCRAAFVPTSVRPSRLHHHGRRHGPGADDRCGRRPPECRTGHRRRCRLR